VIRMLLFGLALVLVMLYRPAGLLPSAVRKRELEERAV
jgi:branched-chain amino acid transport system permease protein